MNLDMLDSSEETENGEDAQVDIPPKMQRDSNTIKESVHKSSGPSDEELIRAAETCEKMIAHATTDEEPEKDIIWKEVHKWVEDNSKDSVTPTLSEAS
jgi:hypothetical protein